MEEWIDLTEENLAREQLCCIIRKKPHPGIEAKRRWLAERLREGHVFRKLNDEAATVFLEYAPLETAWVPVTGENYLYLYCLWVTGEYKGKGYGRALMESCLADARRQGRSGVCMLGAQKQKAWLSDQSFAKAFGFEPVDTAEGGYELLALSLDGTRPRFMPNAKKGVLDAEELTIFYTMQCPYIVQTVERTRAWCAANDVPLSLRPVDTLQKAKELPCAFNNWAVFYNGRLQTVNLLSEAQLVRLLDQGKTTPLPEGGHS